MNWYHHFKRDITSHIEDTLSASDYVEIGIFQPTQVILVGSVGEVVNGHVDFCHLLALELHIGAGRDVQQRVGRRCRLCVVGHIIMVLTEVALQAEGHIRVVQPASVVGELILQIADILFPPAGATGVRQPAKRRWRNAADGWDGSQSLLRSPTNERRLA